MLSRRKVIRAIGEVPIAAILGRAHAADERVTRVLGTPPGRLPDKTSFTLSGTHLNAAFAHPICDLALAGMETHIRTRLQEINKVWPAHNPRDEAVALFAELINAQPSEVAVVPSTLTGENMVASALGLGPGRGVVTDPLHYDASLAMYGERSKRGMPLTVVAPRKHRIDYGALEAAITPQTKLVAVSWVSSWTGYAHDLKVICELAHRKGALVYADIIQGVGAMPLDVKECGVDFCCAGTYKWLMGDFGVAFLYVRPDRLSQLDRTQIGWRSLKEFKPHFLPYDSPGPVGGEWELGGATANLFEVGTPNWAGLAAAMGSFRYIKSIGIDAIARHRAPMLERLQTELPPLGFESLTPPDQQGPFVTFASAGMKDGLRGRLESERIFITQGKNRFRVSVSVYNDMNDIERLLAVLRSAIGT
jgi:selenocysteine lyase/cysteine desulfurase